MPIEIRELIIRTNIDRERGNDNEKSKHSTGKDNKNCCADNMDMILQLLNDKKER